MTRRDATVLALDALLLAGVKALVGAWILHLGFTHVSDDDYARTVIAEEFAHAPRLDPSGTSWLPLPFWVEGAAMMAFGRSLETARGVAFVLGAAGVGSVYLALRSVRVPRGAAALATSLGMAAPWNAWLGVATVPEGVTGALVAAAMISMSEPRARMCGALALLVSSLSRYEAWPVCAAFAVYAAVPWGLRSPEPRRFAAAALAVAGPLLWMAWNAHAHDGPLHFLRRVTIFREAAMGSAPLGEKLMEVPRAVLSSAGALLGLAGIGVAAGLRDGAYRRRWGVAGVAVLVQLAFLAYGAARDEAPTHHPERALVAIEWLLAAAAVDGARLVVTPLARAAPPVRRTLLVGAIAACAALGVARLAMRWTDFPGRGPDELRVAQTGRGAAYRGLATGTLEVSPCAYEHFALVAAFGAPERTTVLPATHERMNEDCPHVVVR